MDREALRNQASSRRSGEAEIATTKTVWTCGFCSRGFQQETAFMSHYCREKERHEQLRGPIGQAAYGFYATWMRLRKHSVPPIENFAESKFYGAFIRFAQHVKKTRLPDPDRFIKLMIDNGNVQPVLWCRDQVFAMYLQAYDQVVSPETQFMRSYDVIQELAVDLKVPVTDVYSTLGLEGLLDLIEKRKLSFWFLLASARFKAYLLALPPEQREVLVGSLNVPAAVERMKAEPYNMREFSAATKDIGL